MGIQITKYGNVSVVTPREDLAGDGAEVIGEKVRSHIGEGNRDIVIDCSEVELFDSTGLETLIGLQGMCESELGILKLCGLNPACQKILEITRLARRFESHDDLDGAVRSFS